MEQFVVPELYCPFPPALNQHAETVDQQSIEWALRFNLLSEECTLKRVRATRIGWLIARAYTGTPLLELQLLCDWTTWLFLQDDQCDELGVGKDPVSLAAMHSRSLAVLRGAPLVAADRPLTHALADLRQRMRQLGDDAWMQRFVATFENSLSASVWEATNRANGVTPDVSTYIKMRAFTGGLYTLIELIEITEQLHLPPEVRKHPVIKRLTRMASNVVCWANDIMSLAKEIKQGDVHNLVLTLRHKHHLTLQEALDRATALHDAEVRAFIDLELRLPSFGTAVDEDVLRYVSILRGWMRGNLDWSYASQRYMMTLLAPVEAN